MIKLFKKDETQFTHDGVEVLDDIVISSYTSWTENSKWVIEAKFKKDFDKSEAIEEGMFLQVPTEKGLQLFRILKVSKKNKKYITVSGYQIGFDFDDNFIQDINIVEKSGRAAIKQIQGGTVYTNKFNLSSNIDTVASARMVRKNGIDALLGSDDNTFVNRWGGYLVLDNFNISMNESVGEDRGVEILVGKNVIDFEGSIDISSVVTGINAITYDGLTLPEGVYYSPLVNNYPHPKIQEFKFDNIKYKYSEHGSEDGYETLEEVYEALRKECDKLFEEQNIDKPTCSLRISIAELSKTDQYKGDELNERIYQGDILTANLDDYGFNVKLKMTANKYNNIKDRYEDIDLGDVKGNALSNINKVQNVIDKVVEQLGGNSWQDILDKSMDEATQLIEAGIKDSYVVARKNEILIMDSPQVESSINVIRMNKNGIAFSQSGYNGPYTLAITIDGKINASCITTGELNAALIKTGILMSSNGKTWINMEDGTFNFSDKITFDGEKIEIVLEDNKTIKETMEDIVEEAENKSGNMIQNSNVLVDLTGFEPIGGNITRYEYIHETQIEKEEEFTPGQSAPNVSEEVTTPPPTTGKDETEIDVVKPPAIKPITSNTQIHFIYTKETGDSILITCDNGKTILIDSVDNRLLSSTLPNSIEPIIKYIKNLGINKIDYIINTHFHSDHAGGLDEIMNTFDVKDSTFIYKEFDNSKMPSVETDWKTNLIKTNAINAATNNGMKKVIPTEKQKFIIDSNTYFEMYNTTYIDYSDYNSSSLVIYFVHGDNKFLLLGDLSPTRQATLYSSLPKNVDVVKDSHHGYNATINTDLIKRCNPQDVVVTRNEWNNLAYNRAYNSIGMWQSYDKNIYTLFKTGSHIIITSNGNDYTLNTNAKFFFENCWLKFNNDNSSWCYFKSGGNYAKSETLVLENKKYDFNSDGFCINPFSPR